MDGWRTRKGRQSKHLALAVGISVWATAGASAQQPVPANAIGSSPAGYLGPAVTTVPVPTTAQGQPQALGLPQGQSLAVAGTPEDYKDLADRLSAAVGQLDATRLPDVAAARSQLERAIGDLKQRFSVAGPQRQADWMRFFQVDALQQELAAEQPNVNRLIEIEKNSRQNYPGLEMPAVDTFRRALVRYIDALRFGADPEATIRGLTQRLEALARELREAAQRPSVLDLQRDLGLMVGYLNSANQAPELVSYLRNRYDAAGARVLVSNEFLSRQFSQGVAESNPVCELILGTTLQGTSFLGGSVQPRLVPNASAATLRLQLLGQLSANNVGTNRGVVLRTTSQAGVSACETIQLTDYGLVQLNDTGVDSTFRSQINSIEHRLRIVRKIAANRAAEQKPQADAIGQARLESRLATQFHEQLSERLAEANSRLAPPPLPVLSRLGLPRPDRNSWSSGDYLALRWYVRSPDQLAAVGSCPIAVPQYGATAQVHQSLMNNYLDTVLAGRTIRSEDLDNFARQFGGLPGTKLEQEANAEPWSITLAGFHPVEVEFDRGIVGFIIRTTRLDRGDNSLAQPATIRAEYQPELVNGAIQLRRVGDVRIDFSGRAQRGLRAVTLRSFLRDKFNEVFREQLFDEPQSLASRLPENLYLAFQQVATSEGWMQLTVN